MFFGCELSFFGVRQWLVVESPPLVKGFQIKLYIRRVQYQRQCPIFSFENSLLHTMLSFCIKKRQHLPGSNSIKKEENVRNYQIFVYYKFWIPLFENRKKRKMTRKFNFLSLIRCKLWDFCSGTLEADAKQESRDIFSLKLLWDIMSHLSMIMPHLAPFEGSKGHGAPYDVLDPWPIL